MTFVEFISNLFNNVFTGTNIALIGAAVAVIMTGIGVPFLISKGADPIVVGALGLTAAYCGTLCTPMAANFNIVPAALLETKNKYSVIKSQLPFAICMLLVHVILLYTLAF